MPGIGRPLNRRDDPGNLPDVDPGLAQRHLGPGIAAVGPPIEADSLAFQRREVADSGAALDEKAAMAERDHREDREADEMPVAARGVHYETAKRCLIARATPIIG